MSINPFPDELAWLWDICAMFIALVILLLIVKINGRIQKSGKLPVYITRKIIHILVAPVFVLTWLLFSGTGLSRYIATIVPLLFVLQFTAIGTGLIKDENSVRSMSRTGDPKELLKGTLFYAIIILIVTLCWFYVPSADGMIAHPGGFVIIGCLAGGDGFADIFGRRYGVKKFGVAGAEKSIVGSLAMLCGSFIFSMGLIAIFSLGSASFNLVQLLLPIFVICVVATCVEIITPPNFDNLTISIAVIIVITLFTVFSVEWWPFPFWTL